MSISFQSSSTNNAIKHDNAATVYVTSAQVAMAVASTTAQRPVGQAVPALLPNSALYQYNNDQLIHMHEIYEEHHRSHPETTAGRSTDV